MKTLKTKSGSSLPILDSQGDFKIVLDCLCKQVTDAKKKLGIS